MNDQLASIEGVLFQNEKPGSAFVIGGETFGLILFDEKFRYQKYISNSSCAAGTGAFLDQQAERLGLSDSAELSRLADSFQGQPPKIATRCAVFAKTDLIHCQQEGYSLDAISAGLCQGLAQNIYDTLYTGVILRQPVMAAGGVSKNPKVIHYLSEMIGSPIVIPEHSALTGAIGCAVLAQSRSEDQPVDSSFTIDTLLKKQTQEKRYFYGPLSTKRSAYPDFTDHKHYISQDVEVDDYVSSIQKGRVPAYLGIDIGSTSTKAVVMDTAHKEQILYGLYTRTAGQPIRATQSLLNALRIIEEKEEIQFDFQGVGTTGSGRNFIRKVINADLAIDEITAHARAAYTLNLNVDTIIEIGGQDSKFTVMKNGHVVFSVMNYVCAAGTGSFIEEQARRLAIPLDEYASRAIGSPSPLTSDRCTVFMERDLNHYLSQGYSKEQLLAAALHSVADNYLSRVATLNKVGKVICFQGATAKNEALVAVFEEKLQKPIFVSRYCHLTGALGVCLILQEKQINGTNFRGIDFYKQTPVVTEEICEVCRNHCKLKRVQVTGESILWGFLCGRDETDNKRKSTNQSGFDLLSNRRQMFNPGIKLEGEANELTIKTKKSHAVQLSETRIDHPIEKLKGNLDLNLLNLRHKVFTVRQSEFNKIDRISMTIGIPNTLFNLEYSSLWKYFFKKLGYHVYISSPNGEFLERGKEIAGAEFCTPMAYWHGQIQDLRDHCDYLFLPQIFQEGENSQSKYYCYYSSYSVALVQNIKTLGIENKVIAPIFNFSTSAVLNIKQLYESLTQELKLLQTPGEMLDAFEQALNWYQSRKEQLVQVFRDQTKKMDDVSVVLLGRPYVIFDPVMNQAIPEKFNQLGIKTFSQDMLPQTKTGIDGPAREFIDWNHWDYGDQILKVLETIGKTEGLYPVFLTAFKCSPDSFVINYFKEIMDFYQKPYLILQVDSHGSDIGYGTRVESAAETFRNHFRFHVPVSAAKNKVEDSPSSFKKKTLLIPSYDSYCSDLICAAFTHAGYQVHVIEETATTVQSSVRLNDGQCLPISSIVQGAVETIQKNQLKPEETVIFLNAICRVACNFPQYPLLAKQLLRQRGDEFEKVQVFATETNMVGFPLELIYENYFCVLMGGLLRKMGCKLRPYEMVKGQTDQAIANGLKRLRQCIVEGRSKEAAFTEIVEELSKIPLYSQKEKRPKVAIIGDLYVQDNDVFNQQIIADLESYGAEVVTVPINYTLRLMGKKESYTSSKDRRYLTQLQYSLLVEVADKLESRYYQIAKRILNEELPTFDDAIFDALNQYNLSQQHGGETTQNVLKVFSLLKHYPDLTLFVHLNPIFCCPGMVSQSIFKTIENDIGVPIVSIIYDGTTTAKNEVLAPYMHYIQQSLSVISIAP